jgi:hypothetical protein
MFLTSDCGKTSNTGILRNGPWARERRHMGTAEKGVQEGEAIGCASRKEHFRAKSGVWWARKGEALLDSAQSAKQSDRQVQP